jgi:predicted acylesterase/phospholipase RssA
MPGVRAWGGQFNKNFQADLIDSIAQEPQGAFVDPDTGRRVYNALALSGGGAHGAFGAGFLNGWSKTGTRPSFKLVTGISTGALIAPFAFLGRDYDERLKEVFTTTTTKSILEKLAVLDILFRSESFTKTDPLETLIAKHIDRSMIDAVAQAHDRGRRLYIGTTHMDAQRLVIWNMGLIAKSAHPEALKVFQKVMLASAAIPAAFPPVLFDVEVDGERFDEMHADGGTATQVFFYAGTVDLVGAARASGLEREGGQIGNLYLIRNGQFASQVKQIPRKLIDISDRAVNTMIKTSAIGDLYRIYAFARREKAHFNYVAIPPDFEFKAQELFDLDEMNRLFEVGYRLGLSEDPWQKAPPGLIVE